MTVNELIATLNRQVEKAPSSADFLVVVMMEPQDENDDWCVGTIRSALPVRDVLPWEDEGRFMLHLNVRDGE